MKNRFFLLIPILVILISCTDDITGLNEDKKRPTYTEANFLFTNAEHALVDQVTSTSVNRNVFRLFAQHWAEVQYPQESQYDVTGRGIPDAHWTAYYRDVLRDFKEAKMLLEEEKSVAGVDLDVISNKIAIIDILSSYTYSILVDSFGDIPYTEALDVLEFPQPKYDDAETIYRDLISKLTTASRTIITTKGSFGDADLIYSGHTSSWVKFANSLRLRLAINMDDVDHAYATSEALAAFNDGIISNSAEGTYMNYASTQPNTNPLYVDLVSTGRDDFIPANTFVDHLNLIEDPRRGKFFTEYPAGSGKYVGGVYGSINTYADFSHLTPTLKDPTYPGVLFTYSEVEFLLAEAVERGISVGGTAAEHYTKAITASLEDWGVAANDIQTYLAKPQVAYSTATGTWKQKIGEQAWISYYNRGFEAWTSFRRLDYPLLKAPKEALQINQVPTRYTYPNLEQTLNSTNLGAAVSKLGKDELIKKIFWDKF